MAITYHAKMEHGPHIVEWETAVTEPVGHKRLRYLYDGALFPTIMVNTATNADWKMAAYPDEDCNSFQTAISILAPASRELALRIANDILHTGAALIPPACGGLHLEISEKHKVEKIALNW